MVIKDWVNTLPMYNTRKKKQTLFLDGVTNNAADCFVKSKHIQEDAAQLGKIKATNGRTRRDIGFKDVSKDLDVIRARKHIHILGSLGHQRVPLERC